MAEPLPLNAAIEIALDGAIDPLTASADVVRVLREDGTALPIEFTVSSGRLRIHLVVTAELLAEGLPSVWVTVAGLPSPGALRTLDGRRLRAPFQRRVPLIQALAPGSVDVPRLVALNGAPPGMVPIQASEELLLTFAGVLDPATISPQTCPLFPVAGDITLLTPRLPAVRWRCVGDRFDLVLGLPPESGPLQCILRRLGVRDPLGRAPEPAGLVVQLPAR